MATKVYDREVLVSTARTATVAATDMQVPANCDFIEVVIRATASSATPSVVPTVQDKYGILLLTGAAITGVSSVILRYGVTAPVVTNLSAPGIPHDGMTLTMTAGDSDSLTYSVRIRAYKI